MLFNSIDFAIFTPIVFFLYWFVANKNLKHQNLIIVIASYVFYGWWDWRFLLLILFSTVIDYAVGRGLLNTKNITNRKILLCISITVNLGVLGFFKYSNFFIDNFILAFSLFGLTIKVEGLDIILPVGVSFYTFQTLSYTIDIYKNKLKPTKRFITFCAFVSFFPQLVAGPIERATNLLPQFYKKRTFIYSKAIDGLRQILWGLFKKIVIADNSAQIANEIFNHSANYSGSTLVLGALFFSFQIYGDFSGYSDIAIGTSKLFGFNLKQNFAFPYFSRDIAEFWRRWHISLSTWFRDYLYIPLGGSRVKNWVKVRNVFIVFIVSGFWHGANWNFIVWGALHALFFLPFLLLNKHRKNIDTVANGKYWPSFKEFFQMITTFCLTLLAWCFFRAENIEHALSYWSSIFSKTLFTVPKFAISRIYTLQVMLMIIFFILIEWLGRGGEHALSNLGTKYPSFLRRGFYVLVVLLIAMFIGKEQQFIYFQF